MKVMFLILFVYLFFLSGNAYSKESLQQTFLEGISSTEEADKSTSEFFSFKDDTSDFNSANDKINLSPVRKKKRAVPPQDFGSVVGQAVLSILSMGILIYPSSLMCAGAYYLAEDFDKDNAVIYGIAAGSICMNFGIAGVVTLIGNEDDIKGSYWSAFGGATIATTAVAFGWYAFENLDYESRRSFFGSTDNVIPIISALILPVAGAMIGFDFSREWVKYNDRSFNNSIRNNSLVLEFPSLSIKQNPYKINTEGMLSLDLLKLRF